MARQAEVIDEPVPVARVAPGEVSTRLLVLEDDARLRRAFAGRLRAEGYVIDEARTLRGARRAVSSTSYCCLVLDRLVPDGDSLDLVAEMRRRTERTPVLVMSALGESDQRVDGLAAGADDYVAKPVGLDELALRVGNITAPAAAIGAATVQLGSVVLDRSRREVHIDGVDVHLTPRQYVVFDYLALRRDRKVLIEELLEHCWDGRRSLFANPVNSQITRLRAVFRGHLRFEVVRGAGYMLRVDHRRTAVRR